MGQEQVRIEDREELGSYAKMTIDVIESAAMFAAQTRQWDQLFKILEAKKIIETIPRPEPTPIMWARP